MTLLPGILFDYEHVGTLVGCCSLQLEPGSKGLKPSAWFHFNAQPALEIKNVREPLSSNDVAFNGLGSSCAPYTWVFLDEDKCIIGAERGDDSWQPKVGFKRVKVQAEPGMTALESALVAALEAKIR